MITPSVFGMAGLFMFGASMTDSCAHPIAVSLVGGILLGLSPAMRDELILPPPPVFRRVVR